MRHDVIRSEKTYLPVLGYYFTQRTTFLRRDINSQGRLHMIISEWK